MNLDPISIGAGLIGSVFDDVFGSIDQGHWEGNSFIPGDLQSRYNEVDKLMRERGLSVVDVDQNQVRLILTSPGIWQTNIQAYLDKLLKSKKATATTNQNIASVGTDVGTAIPTLTSAGTSILSGFTGNTFIMILIIVAAFYFFIKRKH